MKGIYILPVVATIILSSCGISIGGENGVNVSKDSVSIGGTGGVKIDGLDKIAVKIDDQGLKVGEKDGLTISQDGLTIGKTDTIEVSISSGGTQQSNGTIGSPKSQNSTETTVDISRFANIGLSGYQMEQVRLGLENGIDATVYASGDLSPNQMQQIRVGLENGILPTTYAKHIYPNFSVLQMEQVRLGLEAGIDPTVYAKDELSPNEMQRIRLMLEAQRN